MSKSLAIVRMSYSPYGGAETSIEQLRHALKQEQVDLRLTMLTQSWASGTANSKSDLKHEILPQRGLTRASRFRHFSGSVQKYLGKNRFDLTQTHERIPSCDIFRAGDGVHASWLDRLARVRGVPNTLLKLDSYHRLLLRNERMIATDPKTLIVPNSPLVQRELISILGADPQRIRLIPNMINNVLKDPQAPGEKHQAKVALGLDPAKPIILFLGSGFERKGAFQLAEAAVHDPDLQILIVGKDRAPEKLQRRIGSLGLTARVKLLGPQTSLEQFWAATDVFCLPSLYDSFPNAALEALAHGIPCVLTEGVGVVDDWAAAGVALKSTREPVNIAAKIRAVLEDLDRFQSKTLGKARTYSPANVLPLWIDLYEEILSHKQ